MTDFTPPEVNRKLDPSETEGRVFLVVVDNTEELKAAIRYACTRARKTEGRVALLYVIEPVEYQHFMGVGDLMRDEAREEAELQLQNQASAVYDLSERMPALYVREGNRTEEVLKLIKEEQAIKVLVLATGTGNEGPGPLVSTLTGRNAHKLRIPATIVPGTLSEDEIDALT